MKQKIIIVDYGMGNLRSIQNTFKRINEDCIISSTSDEIINADKLILPGVGHFKYGMHKLKELNLLKALNKKVIEQKAPILGICLGTQLFAKHSEEGDCQGLGWIDANVVKFKVIDKINFKVPHIGWNDVNIMKHNKINISVNMEDQFYFVHSYHMECTDSQDIWMMTNYNYEFVSAIQKDNIYGVQFHPEKSHDIGMSFLKKFAEL